MSSTAKEVDRGLRSGTELQLAWIRKVEADGRLEVELANGSCVAAELPGSLATEGELPTWKAVGQQVVVLTQAYDQASCVVVGVVHLLHDGSSARATSEAPLSDVAERKRLGRRSDAAVLNLGAEERVSIRCGKSSIELSRNGRVVIRGTEIVTRASGRNKIKGAAVLIN